MEGYLGLALAALPFVVLIGSILLESRRDVLRQRLGLRQDESKPPGDAPGAERPLLAPVLRAGGMMVVGRFYGTWLHRAGLRGVLAPGLYAASKILAMAAVALAIWANVELRAPQFKPHLCAVACLFVWFAFDYGLLQKGRARVRAIQRCIPFWLDLHCTLVEGGLGLDAALSLIVEETRHSREPMFHELRRLHADLVVGQERLRSYRALAERTHVPELHHVVAAIVQAQLLGAGVVDTLRAQADMMRNRMWEEANTRAEKLPVKLIFPTAIGIVPSVIIVVLAPMLLRIVDFLQRAH